MAISSVVTVGVARSARHPPGVAGGAQGGDRVLGGSDAGAHAGAERADVGAEGVEQDLVPAEHVARRAGRLREPAGRRAARLAYASWRLTTLSTIASTLASMLCDWSIVRRGSGSAGRARRR